MWFWNLLCSQTSFVRSHTLPFHRSFLSALSPLLPAGVGCSAFGVAVGSGARGHQPPQGLCPPLAVSFEERVGAEQPGRRPLYFCRYWCLVAVGGQHSWQPLERARPCFSPVPAPLPLPSSGPRVTLQQPTGSFRRCLLGSCRVVGWCPWPSGERAVASSMLYTSGTQSGLWGAPGTETNANKQLSS